MSEIKHKICPYCGGIMKITEGKVCTLIPPQYEYKCPECGSIDYDTRYFLDYPEIKAPIVVYGDNEPTEASYAVKFRNEAAKDILVGLISSSQLFKDKDGELIKKSEDYVKVAIETADELIRQLKEENEK